MKDKLKSEFRIGIYSIYKIEGDKLKADPYDDDHLYIENEETGESMELFPHEIKDMMENN